MTGTHDLNLSLIEFLLFVHGCTDREVLFNAPVPVHLRGVVGEENKGARTTCSNLIGLVICARAPDSFFAGAVQSGLARVNQRQRRGKNVLHFSLTDWNAGARASLVIALICAVQEPPPPPLKNHDIPWRRTSRVACTKQSPGMANDK